MGLSSAVRVFSIAFTTSIPDTTCPQHHQSSINSLRPLATRCFRNTQVQSDHTACAKETTQSGRGRQISTTCLAEDRVLALAQVRTEPVRGSPASVAPRVGTVSVRHSPIELQSSHPPSLALISAASSAKALPKERESSSCELRASTREGTLGAFTRESETSSAVFPYARALHSPTNTQCHAMERCERRWRRPRS